MDSTEQCMELSSAEYKKLYNIVFGQHDDFKKTVICAAYDVYSVLLRYVNRTELYSTSKFGDLKLNICDVNL